MKATFNFYAGAVIRRRVFEAADNDVANNKCAKGCLSMKGFTKKYLFNIKNVG